MRDARRRAEIIDKAFPDGIRGRRFDQLIGTIVLTGTPLENRIEELVSIVEFIDPFRRSTATSPNAINAA